MNTYELRILVAYRAAERVKYIPSLTDIMVITRIPKSSILRTREKLMENRFLSYMGTFGEGNNKRTMFTVTTKGKRAL